MSLTFSQKKVRDIVHKIAKEHGISIEVAEAVLRSQFETARLGTETKKNTRFPYLFLFYNRENKNEEYLKHRKKIKENGESNKP